jgi:hypothetical protein
MTTPSKTLGVSALAAGELPLPACVYELQLFDEAGLRCTQSVTVAPGRSNEVRAVAGEVP